MKERKPTFDPSYIRDLSEKVYRHQLGPDDTARMIAKDKDQGQKLRGRAAARLFLFTGWRVFRPARAPWGECTSLWTEGDWRWFRIYGRRP